MVGLPLLGGISSLREDLLPEVIFGRFRDGAGRRFCPMNILLTRAKDLAPRDRSQLQMTINRGCPKFLVVFDPTPGSQEPFIIGEMLHKEDDNGVLTTE